MSGNFDFFYCPWNPAEECNLGYAIINFLTRSFGATFEKQWADQRLVPRQQGCRNLRILPAALQGRAVNLRHFSGFALAQDPNPRFRPLVRAGPAAPIHVDPCRSDTRGAGFGAAAAPAASAPGFAAIAAIPATAATAAKSTGVRPALLDVATDAAT